MSALPVYRAALPKAEALLPYLATIDASRWYSNRGDLVSALEARIGDLLGAGSTKIVTAASGTAAIEAAILATAGRATQERPLALIPAYTFVATASAVATCGYQPYLLDVDATTWALDPDRLTGHPALQQAGVVVPVAPYGRAVSQDDWLAFQTRTGVPVLIDAAAAFERLVADSARYTGAIPVTVSFQATKSFSTGEGGAVVWSDFEGLLRVARSLNFGMLYKRECTGPGSNGKLSEYHAAVGLASLDEWESTSRMRRDVAISYMEAARTHGLAERIHLAPDVASNYALFDAGTAQRADEIAAALRSENIESRLWYGRGLHHEPYWSTAARDALPITDRIAPAVIGLPIAPDLSPNAIERVLTVVAHTTAGLSERRSV